MLLQIGSILLVILVTGYGMLYVHRNQKRIEVPMNGAALILVGLTTATMGFLLMQISGNSVTLSIVLSLIYTIACGVLMGGVPYKVNGLNQIIIGFIGATIGSVLGYMTFSSTTSFFVVVLLFLLLVYLILKIFDKQIAIQTSRKKSNKKANKTSYTSSVILASGFIVLLAVILLSVKQINVGIIGQPQKAEAMLDEDNNLQMGTIHVTPSGLDPKSTELTAGTMAKVVVIVDDQQGENFHLVSNAFNLDAPLKKGENIILLDNPIKGQYDFIVYPGEYKGTFIVR